MVDKGIQELISEILRYNVDAGPVSADTLAIVTNQLNSRIRGRGLTAWEILYQRDHESGSQLDLDDGKLADLQENTRLINQQASAKHKAEGGPVAKSADVVPGSLVYIKNDRSKNRGRERYFVVDVRGNDCVLKKMLKTQIRAKEQILKLTEVMLVTPSTVCREDYERGFDSSDEDEMLLPSGSGTKVAVDNIQTNHRSDSLNDNIQVNRPDNFTQIAPELNITDNYEQSHSSDDVTPEENLVAPDSLMATDHTVAESPIAPVASEDGGRKSSRLRKKPVWMEDYEP